MTALDPYIILCVPLIVVLFLDVAIFIPRKEKKAWERGWRDRGEYEAERAKKGLK